MRKWVLVLMMVGLCATMASAAGGLGVFGSYWDTKDLGPGFGGGVKFCGELSEFLAIELRASCVTKFDDWDGDDDLFVIPLEAGLIFTLPLGEDVPLTLYGGGGGGYAIIPEADDVDLDDEFCFYGVAGAAFALNESIAIFGEAQYRFLEIDGAKVDGEKIDTGDEKGKLSGLGVNVGLRFSF